MLWYECDGNEGNDDNNDWYWCENFGHLQLKKSSEFQMSEKIVDSKTKTSLIQCILLKYLLRWTINEQMALRTWSSIFKMPRDRTQM